MRHSSAPLAFVALLTLAAPGRCQLEVVSLEPRALPIRVNRGEMPKIELSPEERDTLWGRRIHALLVRGLKDEPLLVSEPSRTDNCRIVRFYPADTTLVGASLRIERHLSERGWYWEYANQAQMDTPYLVVLVEDPRGERLSFGSSLKLTMADLSAFLERGLPLLLVGGDGTPRDRAVPSSVATTAAPAPTRPLAPCSRFERLRIAGVPSERVLACECGHDGERTDAPR